MPLPITDQPLGAEEGSGKFGLDFKDEAWFQGPRCCEERRCSGARWVRCQGQGRGKLMYVGPMAAAQLGKDGGVEVKGGRWVWVLRAEVWKGNKVREMCLRDESAKQKMKGSPRVIVLCALHSG